MWHVCQWVAVLVPQNRQEKSRFWSNLERPGHLNTTSFQTQKNGKCSEIQRPLHSSRRRNWWWRRATLRRVMYPLMGRASKMMHLWHCELLLSSASYMRDMEGHQPRAPSSNEIRAGVYINGFWILSFLQMLLSCMAAGLLKQWLSGHSSVTLTSYRSWEDTHAFLLVAWIWHEMDNGWQWNIHMYNYLSIYLSIYIYVHSMEVS